MVHTKIETGDKPFQCDLYKMEFKINKVRPMVKSLNSKLLIITKDFEKLNKI